jgi:uncharacterized protein YkwD
MKKLLVLLAALLVSGTLFSQSPSDTIPEDNINLDIINQCVIDVVNEERVKIGLNPLVISEEAMEFSKKHTEWMVETGRYEHSKYDFDGECITGMAIYPNHHTYMDASKIIVNKWMNSPPHKKIILGKYSSCGTYTSVYKISEITSSRSVYVTLDLMR